MIRGKKKSLSRVEVEFSEPDHCFQTTFLVKKLEKHSTYLSTKSRDSSRMTTTATATGHCPEALEHAVRTRNGGREQGVLVRDARDCKYQQPYRPLA